MSYNTNRKYNKNTKIVLTKQRRGVIIISTTRYDLTKTIKLIYQEERTRILEDKKCELLIERREILIKRKRFKA